MNVYLNEISGIPDAITTLFMSKRSWTREKEVHIREVCDHVMTRHGQLLKNETLCIEKYCEYEDWLQKLLNWGSDHITMLRFIDFSITVEGLHRGGQDDWDAHAARYNNRIIRSSTRLAEFGYELSAYYEDKIIPTDIALASLGITAPDELVHDGVKYVKTCNGYIREDMKDNPDVKRGLYMLSIPSNFIFKVNLTEWAHVYKERCNKGHANPEVKECCEAIADALVDWQPKFTRDLFMGIKN